MKRKWFSILFISLLVLMLFGTAVSMAENGSRLFGLDKAVITFARFPLLVKQAFRQLGSGPLMEADPPALPGATRDCGVQRNTELPVDNDYLLISSFNSEYKQAVVGLMRISDGEYLRYWIPPVDSIIGITRHNKEAEHSGFSNPGLFIPQHPFLLSDGSILFNIPSGPLVRLDADSRISWMIDRKFHHSIEMDANGDLWTCLDEAHSELDSMFTEGGVAEDHIIKLSTDGKVLYEKSLIDILRENNLTGIIFGTGYFEPDPLHLNDIQPALDDGPFWEKGDLLLSLRNRSMILLYRPSTEKVTWYSFGDWTNQHDVDFIDSTHIGLYGNDWIRFLDKVGETTKLRNGMLRRVNNYYLIDMETGSATTPFHKAFNTLGIRTEEEGRAELLEGGYILVEETEPGRLIITNASGSKSWIYSSCFDGDRVSRLFWCRYLEAAEVSAIYPGERD